MRAGVRQTGVFAYSTMYTGDGALRAQPLASLCLDGIAVGRPIRHLALVLEYDTADERMVLQILANAGQDLDEVDSKTVNFAAEVHAFAIEPLLRRHATHQQFFSVGTESWPKCN